jgi:opacity protein-like surface antigen
MKKFIVAAVFAVTLASSAHAAATVLDACPAVSNGLGLLGANCDFTFWDAEFSPSQMTFHASSYHDVVSASGNETQVVKGASQDVLNEGDAPVVYSATSGSPIPAGQTCYSFTTGNKTTNWQLVIEVDGSWTLTCNFKKQ